MLANVLRERATARLAVAALALGLFALAGVALVSSDRTARDTARLGEINEIAARWGTVFEYLDVQDAAMADYLRAGDEVGRRPLESALQLGAGEFEWLQEHSEPDRVAEVVLVADTYRSYADTLTRVAELGRRGERDSLARQGQAASLMADSLRKQLTANIASRRLETSEYLQDAGRFNQRLKTAGVGIFGVDVVLLLLCSAVLLSHQRRIERQAAESGHRALHDALTGLPNRVLLGDRVEQAVQAASSQDGTVALLLLDLNRFKEVNDTLGHHFGDLLLECVANRLRGTVRGTDTVARLGGDEFAVLLPTVAGVADADQQAMRLLHALRQPAVLDGITVDLDASIGVALYPAHSHDATQLMQHADIAMYTAKRGRLGTAVYDPDGSAGDLRQLTVLSELRRAIDRDELQLHYQPQVHGGTGEVDGVEASVRWQHPDRGMLLPEEFLPLADQSGLIERLTEYVLTRALDQGAGWHAEGRNLSVAMKIPARCLGKPTFPGLVADLIAERKLPPGLLTLEFAEDVIVNQPAHLLDALDRLSGHGVRISIGDFGNSQASTTHLRTLPVDELKIDPGVVARLGRDPGSETIVRAAVAAAEELDLRIVADGVDDEETWNVLVALGCANGQGHQLGTPLPATDLAGWLADRDAAGARYARPLRWAGSGPVAPERPG
jgi:diguanylate cyclase